MFFEKAKRAGLNEPWRYVVGTLVTLVGWQILGSIPVLALYSYAMIKGAPPSADIESVAAAAGLEKNGLLLLLLSTFMLGCLAVYLVVKYLHKKPFLSILTSREKFSWKRMFIGFGVWSAMTLAFFGIAYYLNPDDYIFSFDAGKFIPLLLIGIFILPFQTTFEEIFMRGYLMQGVGLVTGSRILALLLPATFFGLLHFLNPEVSKYGFGLMMIYYIGMGVVLGILAIMDDGLELPIGVHWANNLAAAVFVNFEDSALKTDALFMAKNHDPVAEMPYFFMEAFLLIVVIAIVLKWTNWKKFLEKIN